MAVIITNRAKKNIRGLYWRSTRGSLNRTQETKSLVDTMISLINTTPLIVSKESRGILGIWKNKGYTIFESTHCFIRRSNGAEFKQMSSRKDMRRKWYFACVVDIATNTVYIVNAVFVKYVDRLLDDTPLATKFISAIKGIETKRKKREAAKLQLTIPFEENKMHILRLTEAQFKRMLTECITKIINEIA